MTDFYPGQMHFPSAGQSDNGRMRRWLIAATGCETFPAEMRVGLTQTYAEREDVFYIDHVGRGLIYQTMLTAFRCQSALVVGRDGRVYS